MQLPKLTPLQSRLLAFAITTCLVVVLWIIFQPNYFAYAAEIPVPPEVVQHSEFEASIPPAPPDDPPLELRNNAEEDDGDALYAPEFAYFDSSLVGRQEDGPKELNNNQMIGTDIAPNTTRLFRFKRNQLESKGKRSVLGTSSVELANTSEGDSRRADILLEENTEDNVVGKRQSQSQLWISANTCRQPTPTVKLITDPPPQLTLWVYTSTSSASPRPVASNAVGNVTFNSGYVNFTLPTNQDVLIGVSAPALTQGWFGSWHFEIAATVDEGYYHNYDNGSNFIYMVDTDDNSALFITHNLTSSNDTKEVDKWKDMQAAGKVPFTMYAFPSDDPSPMIGLERSYCGLQEQFRDTNNLSVVTSVTTNFGQGLPKGQFHVQGLKSSMKYTGFLAVNGSANMTLDGTAIKGGGQVFKAFEWHTKAGDSCQVIFDLEECSTVAYAVPSSPQFKNNDTGLKAFYDNQAKGYMKSFRKSLAQVACDTASTAQYSLARTCKDCENDYKAWLCSVLIPRCEDWSAKDIWLHPRNINTPFADGTLPSADNLTTETKFNDTMRNRFAYNQSRNPEIDKVIKPGPYKELLPCEDLCFDIVRSCPAQLGFACPNPPMRSLSYGQRNLTGTNLTCNFPGAVVDLNQDRNAGVIVSVRMDAMVLVMLGVVVWGWM
ncbi:hypothetical protein N0V90_011162 [Kalmusia sp. IMI 367209]|nr:hypothetical protein N0V90_011162 [Kalmusia sp. IMI 367209]